MKSRVSTEMNRQMRVVSVVAAVICLSAAAVAAEKPAARVNASPHQEKWAEGMTNCVALGIKTANWLRVTTFPEPMLFAPTSMGDFAKYLERASKDFAAPLSLEARRGISFHCSDSAAKKVFPPRSAQTVPLIPDGQSQRVVTFWQILTNACERADCTFEVAPGAVYIHSKHEFEEA